MVKRIPKIVIDAGHGQYGNKGVLGYYEGTQMWYLGQYLQKELESFGWQVTNTRPKISDDPALEWRGQQAKDQDLFVSLHSNAPPSTTSNYSNIRGVAIYDSVIDELDYLEKPLLEVISKLMNTPNLGIKHRYNTRSDRVGQDYYGVLRNATTVAGCPDAMLIEHCYHTNEQTVRWLLNHDNLKLLAKAEAEVINTGWRTQHGELGEEMVYVKQGQGSSANPDPNVYQLQDGFVKIGIEMKNPQTGRVFPIPDGSYGAATASGVRLFETRFGLPTTDGSVFTANHVRELLKILNANYKVGVVNEAELNAEKEKVAELAKTVSELNQEVSEIQSTVRGFMGSFEKLNSI